jgi:hypothetical protein
MYIVADFFRKILFFLLFCYNYFMLADKILKYLNISLFFVLLVVIGVLIILDINPSGKRTVFHSVIKPNGLVDGPRPADRLLGVVGNDKITSAWEVAIDPVYFELYIPRLYQRITFELIIDPGEQDIIELGGLGSSQGWQVSLKPAFDASLISSKQPEMVDERYYKLRATFTPEELFLAGHIYTFVVSAPDLKINNHTLKIREANFYLEKEPITLSNLPKKAQSFWERLMNKF